VQDLAATFPARLLGNVAGRRVLDLCAAPGGKTMQLAAAGARVTAVETDPERALVMRANIGRMHLQDAVETVVADARRWSPEALFDLVLLDAPCSATGTIRRHPDILWSKTASGVARLAGLQDELLRAASRMVAPGGRLVYAVCSLQPEEGAKRIEAFLGHEAGFHRDPIDRAELLGLPVDLTPAGELRTLPCHLAEEGGMDGFFVARLRRA
jgi:16S rRNA (cytosine967-C5)-methyltransferase